MYNTSNQDPHSTLNQTQSLQLEIQTTKQRIQQLNKQIQYERNKRLILDQLELGNQTQSQFQSEKGSDSRIRSEASQKKQVKKRKSSYVEESGWGSSSGYSVSSRDIVDQYQQIKRYMTHHNPKQQPNTTIINHNPINPSKQNFNPSPQPVYNQPKSNITTNYQYYTLHHLYETKKYQPSPQYQANQYKSNPNQYLKQKLKQNISSNIVEQKQISINNVSLTRTKRRKSIFNNPTNNNTTYLHKQQQQLTQQQQIQANITKKYKQFEHKNLQSKYQINSYHISTSDPYYERTLWSRQQSQYNIIPVFDKKHDICLQIMNKQTNRYRRILKKTNKQESKCISLGNTIREISVYQRILSNN